MVQFWQVFGNLYLVVKKCYQTINFDRTKLVEWNMPKIQMGHFEPFSNNVRFFNQEIIGEKIWQE